MMVGRTATEVFSDASIWISLVYGHDKRLPEAGALWRRVTEEKRSLVTTTWTVYEAITFLSAGRRRHDLATRVLRLANTGATIVNAAQYEREALEIFTSHSDKRWSVVDCASFVCMGKHRTRYALSFDGDFAQAQAEFRFNTIGVSVE